MRTRKLTLDICDYNNKVLCNLYDNQSDVSGQAVNVIRKSQRNGWKTLNFSVPSTCNGENGPEHNYRLDYLIADYRIRLVDDYEIDWYLISEPKVTHNQFSKNYDITAGHVSQLLKTKNLNLEFSDEEGNNVGTASQLLATILEGTGWKPGEVAEFYDEDGTVKSRSLNAPAKTGAFKMITDMCDLFEAKPVFHGDSKTVDILPMNPFSKTPEGKIPEGAGLDNVLELHYDKNIHGLSRTANTENMVTKFYAYGAYGDANLGMCSIQTCKHEEYTFLAPQTPVNSVFKFTDNDGVAHYFTVDEEVAENSKLVWSRKDFTSRSYLWNENTKHAYHSCKPTSPSVPLDINQVELIENLTPELFDFDYYDKVGLFTNDHLQAVAAYQREMPGYYKTSIENSTAFVNSLTELSEIAQSNTGFLKLAVKRYGDEAQLHIVIDQSQGTNGVIYRSDYREARKNYFQWNVATDIKDNGLPLPSSASILYILHDTEPVTFDKFYVKEVLDPDGNPYLNTSGEIGNYIYSQQDTDPAGLVLFADKNEIPVFSTSDRFYLFCTDSMSGRLGTAISTDDALPDQLSEAVKDDTIYHPIYFGEEMPPVDLANYGWFYKYYKDTIKLGELYFCWAERGETTWNRLYVQEEVPEVEDGAYFYDRKKKKFYHGEGGEWVWLETVAEERVGSRVNIVFHSCRSRDMAYHGYYEKYLYTTQNDLPAGNYAIQSDYDFYWVFSTQETVEAGTTLTLDTVKGYVYIDSPKTLVCTVTIRTYDTIEFPSENVLTSFTEGIIDDAGVYFGGDKQVSTYSRVYENELYEYNLPSGTSLFFYTNTRTFLESKSVGGEGTLTVPANCMYVRSVTNDVLSNSQYFRVSGYQGKLYLSDKMYKRLNNISPSGELIGINNLIKKFGEIADRAYEKEYENMIKAQKAIQTKTYELNEFLGDLLREGFWTDDSYIEGDEDKLYTDAMDNFEKIAWPEMTYSFEFIDLFGAHSEDDIEWPDIKETDAAHLVDPELDVNRWAYIDSLDKCYDKPKETKLEINTNLSLIGQHSFTDVMTRIAEVSNETKSKQSIYERAAALTTTGKLSADKLTGAIETGKNQISGGSANWYTDDKGRIVLQSSNGQSSMMLSGDGWMLSNAKDAYGEPVYKAIATGQGITADAITTGTLSAKLLEAGSVTADKIDASVGQELEIGSNKALVLFATTDGSRPAGALSTQDAVIDIRAGDGENPAKIDIRSGGQLNIESGSYINIESGGNFNVKSGGKMDIDADGELSITARAAFKLDTPNLKVNLDDQGSVVIAGDINTSGAMIAGFTLGQEVDDQGTVTREYMYNGTDSLDSTEPGVYLGTDGVNFGGDFIYRDSDESVHLDEKNTYLSDGRTLADANKMISGSAMTLNTEEGTGSIDKDVEITSNAALKIGNGKKLEIGSDGTNSYIRNGLESLDDNTSGVYFGTDGIAAGEKFRVDKAGKVLINSGSLDIKDSEGITNFSVLDNGHLTANDVDINGQIEAFEGSVLGSMYVGSDSISSNADLFESSMGISSSEGIAFWAGGAYQPDPEENPDDSPNFYAMSNGKMHAESIDSPEYTAKEGTIRVTPDKGLPAFTVLLENDTEANTINLSGETNTLHFYGTTHSASSKDVKHDIQPLKDVGEKIDKLNPVSFVYNNDPKNRKNFGLIYEEAINVFPEICTQDENRKAIEYTQLVSILVKEIQSLRKRIEILERK